LYSKGDNGYMWARGRGGVIGVQMREEGSVVGGYAAREGSELGISKIVGEVIKGERLTEVRRRSFK